MTEFIKLELVISKECLKINEKEYKANIQFDNNEIIVCDETKENDIWLKELLENPTDFKHYTINYQEKKYEVLAETLLTIIIYKFKKEMKEVINQFELIIPDDREKEIAERIKSSLLVINIPNSFTEIDEEISERIKSSLLVINIPNSFTEINEETYLNKPRLDHYVKEDYIITKILDGDEEYQRFKREIERAKQIKSNDVRLLEITDYNQWYTKEKHQEWKMKFTCKEREELKLHH